MSDPIVVALITAISTIVVALIGRDRRERKAAREDRELSDHAITVLEARVRLEQARCSSPSPSPCPEQDGETTPSPVTPGASESAP